MVFIHLMPGLKTRGDPPEVQFTVGYHYPKRNSSWCPPRGRISTGRRKVPIITYTMG